MHRRQFLGQMILVAPLAVGCRGKQVAHVLTDQADMVGSHEAGAETWKPLVAEATCKLLAGQQVEIQQVTHEGGLPPVDVRKRICFVGVENKSQEELGEQDDNAEIDELRKKIEDSKMSDEVRAVAKKQLSRMSQMASSSPEYNIARTYVENLLEIARHDNH